MSKRTQSVSKMWNTYERVWAQNGVIRVQSKNGRTDSIDVPTAVLRVDALNQSLGSSDIPSNQRKKALALVEKLTDVIREAASQLETPDDKTKALHNALKGLTAEGKPIPAPTPEQMLQRIQFRFPMLTVSEVAAVVTEKGLQMAEKIRILHTINEDRLLQVAKAYEERLTAAPANGDT
jgi:hypothetical protein